MHPFTPGDQAHEGMMTEDDQADDDRKVRREAFAADVERRTGIDEAMIERLVHAFYARIRADSMLGPVFVARIAEWPPHLAKMCNFWSSVTLMTGRYHGRPMPAHAALPIEPAHFARWLELFAETAIEVCPPAAAQLFIGKSRMIASSLEQGVAMYRDSILAPGERIVAGPTPESGHG